MKHITVWACGEDRDDLKRVEGMENGNANAITERLPEGIYTTLRTFRHNHVLYLDHHFDRLEESAKLAGTDIEIDRISLRNKMRIAIYETEFLETKLRIHIPFQNIKHKETYLILEPLTVPTAEEVAKGAAIVTRFAQRTNPLAKISGFLAVADEIRKGLGSQVNEVLMIGQENDCLEGLSSNFYAVDQNVIWTAEDGILHGITRKIVLDVIREKQIQVESRGYPFTNIYNLDEAFITSTSRGVLAVTSIDEQKIGNGQPGPMTGTIQKAYKEKINRLIEEI